MIKLIQRYPATAALFIAVNAMEVGYLIGYFMWAK